MKKLENASCGSKSSSGVLNVPFYGMRRLRGRGCMFAILLGLSATAPVSAQTIMNQSHCLMLGTATLDGLQPISNMCSDSLRFTYCWGSGLRCESNPGASRIDARGENVISRWRDQRALNFIAFACRERDDWQTCQNETERYFSSRR